MAEIRWIKLTVNMFDDEKIRLIQAMPESDAILVIWIRLLSLAGKTNSDGQIYIDENMAYSDEMLATLFNKPVNIIRLALQTLKSFGMIDIFNNGVIFVNNWEKHQNIEGMDKIREQNRLRKQKERERKSNLLIESEPKNVNKIDGMDAICNYCGKYNMGLSEFQIDHIVPLSKGGSGYSSNKILSCRGCNASKKDKDVSDFMNDCLKYGPIKLNMDLVLKNEKLMNIVKYDNQQFVMRQSRDGHATDIELELDIELDKESNKDYVGQPDDTIPYKEIISYLNEKANKKFKPATSKYQTLIKARWNEGQRVDDFKQVIDNMVAEWTGTTFSDGKPAENFLQPSTLFGPKFDQYLNTVPKSKGKEAESYGGIDY